MHLLKTRFASLLLLCFVPLLNQAQVTLDSTVLAERTVISGIDIPWEITWGADGYIWTTERYGRVSKIDPVSGNQDVVLDISSSVYQQSESGLLGLALHPDFPDTAFVYLAYTYGSFNNVKERIVRYDYNGTALVNEVVLLDNIQGNTTHDGCRLLVLPDRTLLATTGDAQNLSSPLDTNSLNGKVLRMNLNGSIPADNPMAASYVYSYGHRNAQGLCISPDGSKIYASEHGPTTDDEFQLIVKGGNYGWPTVEGFCNTPSEQTYCNANNVVEPLVAWTPTIAPSDIVFYDSPLIPEFNGAVLMTVLKDKELIRLELSASGEEVLSQKAYFTNRYGRLRDICFAPDGTIYLATNGASWNNNQPFTHSIIELKPLGANIGSELQHINFSFFPNPTEGLIKLDFPVEAIGKSLEIWSLEGKQMKIVAVNHKTQELDLGGLTPGIYFLKLEGNVKKVLVR